MTAKDLRDAMFALLFIIFPVVEIPNTCIVVDWILVNRVINYETVQIGGFVQGQPKRYKIISHSDVMWTSFWRVDYQPPWGMCRIPVVWYCGYIDGGDPTQFTVKTSAGLIVSPRVDFTVTSHDIEHRYRLRWPGLSRPICLGK